MVHIAGPEVQVGERLRQRCGWCGALLVDVDLDRVAVLIDPASDPRGDLAAARPATWPVGELVAVDGHVSYVVEHVDGDPPAGRRLRPGRPRRDRLTDIPPAESARSPCAAARAASTLRSCSPTWLLEGEFTMHGKQILYTAVVALAVVVAYDRVKGGTPLRRGTRVAP